MPRTSCVERHALIAIGIDFAAVEALLGDRISQAYAFRQLLRAGTVLAFGSDAPVAPPGVISGLLAATGRAALLKPIPS